MDDAGRLMALFEGFDGAHGTHGKTEQSVEKGGKLEIKKSARTVREPVTLELWTDHVAGERPLGSRPDRAGRDRERRSVTRTSTTTRRPP